MKYYVLYLPVDVDEVVEQVFNVYCIYIHIFC